jgi:phosphate-selective porin OprO/OprP
MTPTLGASHRGSDAVRICLLIVLAAAASACPRAVAADVDALSPTTPWSPPADSLTTAPSASLAPTPAAEMLAPLDSAGAASVPATSPPTEGIVLDDLIRAAGYLQAGSGTSGAAKNKYPLIAVSGAAQIDGVWFAQDDANEAVVGDAQDVAGFRRSRIGANGNLADNVKYRMEYDFAFPGRPNFTDVWASTSGIPLLGNVKVGQWKQPFSMEPATSFREIMFMERSLAFALVPFRQVGIGAFNQVLDQSATWAVSGYRFPTDAFGNHFGDSGYGMATRGTAILWGDGDGNVLHLGGSYSFNNPGPATLRIRSTPEVGFTQLDFSNTTNFPIPFFVDSGVLPTDNYQILGSELAARLGSLTFQSELMVGMVNRTNAGFVQVPAGYAQLGYVLTGERRTYDKAAAAFTRVVPDVNFGQGGSGAWEAAVRYSALDLNDGDVPGGRLQDVTCGLNWYLNRYTRVEFNYIHAILDRPVGNETDADIFGTRAQFDF